MQLTKQRYTENVSKDLFMCLRQYKEGKRLKPKPNYNSVDLMEVEWEDTEEKVSNAHTSLPRLAAVPSVVVGLVETGGAQCATLVFQLRTAMVRGETGTMALDVRASVDKGVSRLVFVNVPHG